jgi:hypothetical protein
MNTVAGVEVIVRLRAVDRARALGVPSDHPALVGLRAWARLHALVERSEQSDPIEGETPS